ncbi:xylose isomerase 1 [Cladochytrium replicatum]|nr:xylose isomerase 1 [Cladochytrium replicatum]
MTVKEFFASAKQIEYKGPSSEDPLSYRWYNKDEVILGKKMSEWLKFSVCYWHTFRGTGLDPFGTHTLDRPWYSIDRTDIPYAEIVEYCKARVDAAFEFFTKLGVEYYTFHDRDVSPELATLAETNQLLDEVTDYMLKKQEATGVKLLWGTANLFSAPRFAQGAGTSCEFDVYATAAAQVKKAMDVTHKLGGSAYIFWGGREGYASLLNTNVRKELDNMAALFKMAVAYKEKIGATFTFMIEPKPREPMKHQYDYDAQTVIGFLKTYGLDKDFKLNIEPNHTTLAGHEYVHDILVSAEYDFLGSIDCNTGDPLVGWDTDQFLMNDRDATLVMMVVLKMGGFTAGGLNFDCKVRRESTDLEDMFISHIGSMDCFAKGLRMAAHIQSRGRLAGLLEQRYASWTGADAKGVVGGAATFEELEQYVLGLGAKLQTVRARSGKQELFERVFADECDSALIEVAKKH